MRLLNLEFFQHAGADLLGEKVKYYEKPSTALASPAYRRILKERRDNVRDIVDFGRVLDGSPKALCRELIRYCRLSLPLSR